MHVPVYERREGIIPLPANNVSPLMPAGDGGTSMLEAAKGLTLKLQQMQNDTEDARTLELFNKFKRDSLEYHENPDKGLYNTRLGYHSQGVYGEADQWLRQTGEDYVKGLKSSRAKANFRKMAEQYIQQRGMQNSRFEADQMKKYQTEQADATYKNGLNDIALNVYDDNAVENIKQNMTDALELLLRYKSPEERKNALATMDSDIASARMAVMLQQDPEKADKWFRENKNLFNAQSALKYENALESYRVQSAVDILIEQFPEGSEREALQWIRKNFSGEREERIVSAYKTQMNELILKKGNEERELKQQQTQLRDQILNHFVETGELPSDEELSQLVRDSRLNWHDYETIQQRRDVSVRRSKIEQKIRRQNPQYTQDEIDIAVMRQMGFTKEDYQNMFTYAANAYMEGIIDDKGLKELYDRGLPAYDVNTIKKNVKKLDDVQKAYYNNEVKELGKLIDDLVNKTNFPAELKQGIINDFTDSAIRDLNPRAPKYREDLQELRKKVILNAINSNNIPTKEDWALFGNAPYFLGVVGWKWNKLGVWLGEDDEKGKSGLKGQTLKDRGIEEYKMPELKPRDIDLSSKTSQNTNTSFNPVSMVSGGRITGRFSDWRAYRNGQHNGIDVATKEGTDIVAKGFGIPLAVSKISKGKTAGNKVVLTGEYDNGDKIEVHICHMKNDSIAVKQDQTVNEGDIIGQVGSTGHSTGPHMDLKIKINGKYVDPEKWQPPIANTTKLNSTKQNNYVQQKKERDSLDDIFGLGIFDF